MLFERSFLSLEAEYWSAFKKFFEKCVRADGQDDSACQSLYAQWENFSEQLRSSFTQFFQADQSAVFVGDFLYQAAAGIYAMPSFGPFRELEKDYLALCDASHRFANQSIRMQGVYSSLFTEACTVMQNRIKKLQKSGEQINTIQELIQFWAESLDQSAQRYFTSEDFLSFQSEYTRALIDYNNTRKKYQNRFAGILGLPTRNELDSIHKKHYELKKTLKTLTEELQTQETQISKSRKRTQSLEKEIQVLKTLVLQKQQR